jgi:hypothetical protein
MSSFRSDRGVSARSPIRSSSIVHAGRIIRSAPPAGLERAAAGAIATAEAWAGGAKRPPPQRSPHPFSNVEGKITVPAVQHASLASEIVSSAPADCNERTGYAGRVTPVAAWKCVVSGEAVLVDVRSPEEYKFVGRVAEAVHVPWASGPHSSEIRTSYSSSKPRWTRIACCCSCAGAACDRHFQLRRRQRQAIRAPLMF